MTVSLVARRHGVAPKQLWWQGALTADGSGEEVVPASDYRALRSQVRELQRLSSVKTTPNPSIERTRIGALDALRHAN